MALLLAAAPTFAGEEMIIAAGKDEYKAFCVPCHGDSGTGGRVFSGGAPDLTRLAEKNGGAFPFWEVYGMIEESVPVEGHAGMSGLAEHLAAGNGNLRGSRLPIYVRILTLTHYLETIQD